MFSVQNTTSVTNLRSDLSFWLDQGKNQPILMFQNSKPIAAIVDPEYLEYLEKYANGFYDPGDAAEADRALNQKEDAVDFDLSDYA